MKLYEFIYVDRENLSNDEQFKRISAFLETEAQLQGWGNNYTFKMRQAQPMNDLEKSYVVRVYGTYNVIYSEIIDADG